MELRAWLVKAGLSGRPLQLALQACEENCLESIADLELAAKNESEYKETFPQSGIRVRISAALDNEDETFVAQAQPTRIPRTANAPHDISSNHDLQNSLPEGKRYAAARCQYPDISLTQRYPFFASHKKSHTRFSDASADLARATKVSHSSYIRTPN